MDVIEFFKSRYPEDVRMCRGRAMLEVCSDGASPTIDSRRILETDRLVEGTVVVDEYGNGSVGFVPDLNQMEIYTKSKSGETHVGILDPATDTFYNFASYLALVDLMVDPCDPNSEIVANRLERQVSQGPRI